MDVHLSQQNEGGITVIVHGEIDIATGDDLLYRLRQLADPQSRTIALDLSRVSFMDCAGLRTLIIMDRQARSAGGRLVLAAVSPSVARLLSLVGLSHFGAPTPAAAQPATPPATPPADGGQTWIAATVSGLPGYA
jgi:anti-sigma B factor antagonist